MEDSISFSTEIKWNSGSTGKLSDTSLPELIVAPPPVFKSGLPNTWSPEHLFVAAVNSCLMTTFVSIAENSGVELASYSCRATGKLEKVEGKFKFTRILLKPVVSVKKEKDIERVRRLIKKAEEHCLISNSIHAEVELEPKIKLRLTLD